MKVTMTNKVVLTLFLFCWFITGISVINYAFAQSTESVDTYSKLRLFTEAFNRIRQNYIYDVDVDSIIDAAIEGMVNELDAHTNFFNPDDFDEFRTGTQGKFGGLGISIDKQGDYITVIAPIEGTPAYMMGIMAGDKIVRVDGESLVGVTTNDAIKKMRGDVGTPVTIHISRPGVEGELEFNIIRDLIEIKSVPYSFILDNGVGYVRVRQFNSNTSKELRENLDDLEKQGISGLIIDLRFNPGGLLNEAIDTVNEFVGANKKVVFTRGRIPQANQDFYTRYDRIRSGYPVVVIINEASASASEIFAGSMQDWDKGLVVGKTSFGKGSVQQLYPLPDGYGIKVTTSKYFIHSGRGIHKNSNDRVLKGEEITEEEQEKLDNEARKEVFYTDMGRRVYGGGGITPDIEIEQSTLNIFQVELRRRNLFFPFSIEYMLKNENSITEIFEADDSVVRQFIDYATEKGVEFSDENIEESYDWIKHSVTHNIISRKFGDKIGYIYGIKSDDQLQEAIKLFDRFDTLEEMFDYAGKLNQE